MPEKLLTFLENGSLMKVGISEEYQSFVAMASRSVKIDCPYCTVCCTYMYDSMICMYNCTLQPEAEYLVTNKWDLTSKS